MVSLRGEELWVAGCVQAALPGVTVGQHDDNSIPNMHDLDLSVGGCRTFGAMEATAAIDPELIQCWKLLTGRGDRWIEPKLVGGWAINVRPNARIKDLFRDLPELLQALENLGITAIPGPAVPAELIKKQNDLGVLRGHQGDTSFSGSIYVTPEIPRTRRAGVVASTGDALSEWVSAWIIEPSRSDNLAKLRWTAACERHLFVVVPGFTSTAPFSVMDLLMRPNAPLPTVSPILPPEVTHVWVMSGWTGGHGFRWSPEYGWERFANDAVLDRAALVGCTCREQNSLGIASEPGAGVLG